jgi:hypothetical protein
MQSILIILFLFTGLFLASVITVILHELGHAIFALLFTNGRVTLYIGSHGDPSTSFQIDIARLRIFFRYKVFLQGTGLCVAERSTNHWIKNFIITLGGPATSLVISGLCLYTMIFPEFHGAFKLFAFLLFVSSVIDFSDNIRVCEEPIMLFDGSITFNDGKSLKELIKNRKSFGKYKQLLRMQEEDIMKGKTGNLSTVKDLVPDKTKASN